MINSFDGEYSFLSNFYDTPVIVHGVKYKNSEAAYQSAKAKYQYDWEKFKDLTAMEAKKLARKIEVRPDWEDIKDSVMYEVCSAKFKNNSYLKQLLLQTKNKMLVESNHWNDTYWGVCNGEGKNKLGKILMKIREELMNYSFNTKNVIEDCTNWIGEFFDKNSVEGNAIIGISGGVDSSVVAALCVKALGKDRVIGVLMPNGEQKDIDDAIKLVNYLGIKSIECNIENAVNAVLDSIKYGIYDNSAQGEGVGLNISRQTSINLPPRIRMATLYAVSQSLNGRVANTCNLSEDWVGYSTRYGDTAGDFSPLANLTKTEVVKIAEELLPEDLAHKVPSDGLCGSTDEENLGFPYSVEDRYIRTGYIDNADYKTKIDALHYSNQFKLMAMPNFEYGKTSKDILDTER